MNTNITKSELVEMVMSSSVINHPVNPYSTTTTELLSLLFRHYPISEFDRIIKLKRDERREKIFGLINKTPAIQQVHEAVNAFLFRLIELVPGFKLPVVVCGQRDLSAIDFIWSDDFAIKFYGFGHNNEPVYCKANIQSKVINFAVNGEHFAYFQDDIIHAVSRFCNGVEL